MNLFQRKPIVDSMTEFQQKVDKSRSQNSAFTQLPFAPAKVARAGALGLNALKKARAKKK
jgi:hypothetical protein